MDWSSWFSFAYQREWLTPAGTLPPPPLFGGCRVKLGETPQRGRGLFLDGREAKRGEVLVVCEPMVIAEPSALQEAAMEALKVSGEEAFERFMCLHDGHGIKPLAEMDSNVNNWARWSKNQGSKASKSVKPERVKEILRSNTIARDVLNEKGSVEEATLCGVWPLACLVNHSCIPNVQVHFLGDFLILRAASNIAPGEELLMSYVSPLQPHHLRQEHLSSRFNFTCSCPRCKLDEAIPET